MNFETVFGRLIGHEGGWSDDPRDPGNWTGGRPNVGQLKGTKFGIAANTYPDIDIKGLTLDAAKSIYRRDWWDKIHADELPGAIAFQVWDFAVNAGMSRAVISLQRAVGVADDGKIGPRTLAAVAAMSVTDVLSRFNAERLEFYASLSTWATYGKGWARRVAGNLRYAAEDS